MLELDFTIHRVLGNVVVYRHNRNNTYRPAGYVDLEKVSLRSEQQRVQEQGASETCHG